MAANIATSADGSAMIASKNILPWHKSGTLFTEDVSGQEMLKLARLDWDVLEAPVYADTGILVSKATGWDTVTDKPIFSNVLENVIQRQIKGKKTVYRSDTGAPLGIVGEDFKVFQNTSMIQMFENLVNGHKIQYDVAGGLDEGQTVWILAKIPDLKLNVGGDEIEQYMLIRNGHIGNMTLACYPTAIRVVCNNTLTAANAEFKARFETGKGKGKRKMDVHTGYAIRHTSNMMKNVEAVEKAYASMLADFTLTEEMFNAMVGKQHTTEMKNSFFNFVVDPLKDEAERAKELSKSALTRQSNKTEVLEKLLESETNQTPASKGTVWGLYNAACEYVDYHRGTRCGEGMNESECKFESAMFGSGAALKDAVFIKALEMVTA